MDGLRELFDAAKTRVVECLALEDAKPNFHLVEPARAGGREMEGDVGVAAEPFLILLVFVTSRVIIYLFLQANRQLGGAILIGQDFNLFIVCAFKQSETTGTRASRSQQDAGGTPALPGT